MCVSLCWTACRVYTTDMEVAPAKLRSFTAPRSVVEDTLKAGPDDTEPQLGRGKAIADREDEYHAQRRSRIISPARHDPFAEVRWHGPILCLLLLCIWNLCSLVCRMCVSLCVFVCVHVYMYVVGLCAFVC